LDSEEDVHINQYLIGSLNSQIEEKKDDYVSDGLFNENMSKF